MGQPTDEMLMLVIGQTLDSSRRYREMAREYMAKADDLEAMALKVALDAQHRGEDAKAKAKTEAELEEVMKNATEKNAKDVFENFGDIFGGKKGSKK